MATITAGHKAGARKVDVEAYMPEPGDWEETNVLHDFGDGWLICEDKTEYDRRLMAALTKTCIGSYGDRCYPGGNREQLLKDKFEFYKQSYQSYGSSYGDEWVEAEALKRAKQEMALLPPPVYKLAHLRDPKGRPRCALLMALWDAARGTKDRAKYAQCSYLSSNDLGQPHPIVIDGMEWAILECRIGTGKGAPAVAEARITRWYHEATGEWDEAAYQAALTKRQRYTQYTSARPSKSLRSKAA